MKPAVAPLALIAAEEARRILRDVTPVGTETVALEHAVGRVLATALVAPENAPRDLLSAMDGYAVRAADVVSATPEHPVRLRVLGDVFAGTTFAGSVDVGDAVSIVTGGVVPAGADAVAMVEFTRTAPDAPRVVWIHKPVAGGAHVVQPGEDFVAGAEVLAAGRRLRASDLAALAAFGVTVVPVFRRPRIAVFASGAELCRPDQVPRPGHVRDSNSYVLAAQVEQAGCAAVRCGIVDDDVAALRETVLRLCAENDGVILSGGSSVGPKDLTGQVLGGLPAPGVLFHGIDIRPGKPTIFARAGNKPVVGMPGYPTSSMVVFEAFVRPMLARLGGEVLADDFAAPVRARLTQTYEKPIAREDHLRVAVHTREAEGEGGGGGDLWAEVIPGGSAAISNVLRADGLARIVAGVARVHAGDWVRVRMFSL